VLLVVVEVNLVGVFDMPELVLGLDELKVQLLVPVDQGFVRLH
jgi:hypothetical protein